MKKILSAFMAAVIITGSFSVFAEPLETASPQETPAATEAPYASDEPTSVPAEETPAPTASPETDAIPTATASPVPTALPSATPRPPEKELSKEFVLTMVVTPRKYIVSKNAVIELYSMDDTLLGSQLRYVGWDTPSVTMNFEVPEYRMGEKFKIKLVDGLRSIWYYGQGAGVGETLEVQTYGYLDENGAYVQNNGATIDVNPHYDKEIHLYITNKWYNSISPHARVVDDITMAPVRNVAEAMGLNVKYDADSDSVTCSIDGKAAQFWANNEYITTPKGAMNAPHQTVYIDGSLFIPVRTLAEAFDCTVEATDYGEFIDVLIGEAPVMQEIRNRIPVNKNGIGSKTNYLVWVSKSEYKVRVYEGQQYHWKQLKEFPCALGAWNTPTVTGQFEYIERTRWDYGSYYVAPVLRFYNGYALHSTLLSYGGGEYDGRVGVNISHGCVRLHPQDINWIASTIPFHTRIYITE